MKKTLIKAASLIASVSMLLTGAPVLAAQETEYATREYVVSEFVQSVGRSNLVSNGYVLSTFKDAKNVSIEYMEDLEKATTNGLLRGYEDGTIRPKDNITRVEALTILSRCIPETDDVIGDSIAFTDVPEWAKKTIDGLSKVGIVKGYGDGTLGAEDYITVEQVKLLTDRSDEILNTVTPGESFYGYVNNKAFRNFEQGQSASVDYVHGVLVPNENSWSSFGDIITKITNEEDLMLKKLVNGEIKYEKGSPEQRIYDMLSCIGSKQDTKSADAEFYNGFRQKIIDAKNVEELLKAANDIFAQTGVNVLFDVGNDLEPEKHDVYPFIDVKSPGLGGLINYSSVAKKFCGAKYKEILTDCLKYSGMEFSDKDVKDAIKLQEKISAKKSYLDNYASGLMLKSYFDPEHTEEQMEKDLEKLKKEHPDEDENQENVVYTFEEADSKIKEIKVSEILTNAGFKNVENVMMPSDDILKSYTGILTNSNLKALKANALLSLEQELMFFVNEEEEKAYNDLAVLNFIAIMLEPIEESDYEDDSQTEYNEEEQTSDGNDDVELTEEERLLTINACYLSVLNTMNIFAGILNAPMYDPDASYASNLGAIGAVIGHEIGHAFDANGSKYDENGVPKDWWTPEDAKKYEEIKQHFIDYYMNFEVMDDVVQDSETTIGENMADFAGMQCIMDIIGDDPEAQKEALESWARVWAQIGSASIIADESVLHDVHSTNQVRVNAIIASLDCFYDLYDIDEDDEMYVAPEDRLKLW